MKGRNRDVNQSVKRLSEFGSFSYYKIKYSENTFYLGGEGALVPVKFPGYVVKSPV